MSLAVYLKEVLNLRGNLDRIAKLTFRGRYKMMYSPFPLLHCCYKINTTATMQRESS